VERNALGVGRGDDTKSGGVASLYVAIREFFEEVADRLDAQGPKGAGDMSLGTRTVALVTILALHSGTSVQATPNLTGYPNSMAATGDSITRAYNTGTLPFSDRPDNSWSTGTRTSVGSHYGRIQTAEP